MSDQQPLDLSDYQYRESLAEAGTIPSRWYTDARFLELETERLFSRHWQPVGRTEMVARAGDFFTTELAGEPLVITRSKDGSLRGFFNVCKHRAGPVASGRGNRSSLQCRYHGWTYGLDGRLLSAPEFDGVAGWNKKDVCLTPVAVAQWGPVIYANLRPAAPSLESVLGPIMAEVEEKGIPIETMSFIERRDYIIDCNWKVYVDNYLEGYHIPIAHPGLFREVDYDNYFVETLSGYSKQHAPMRPASDVEALNRDRRFMRTEAEEEALYYWVFPNTMFNFYPDNMQLNVIIPLDHERTLTIFEWYFEQPGTGGGWESMQQSIAFSDEVQREDIEICETVQKGLRSRSYDVGRFSVKRENGVHHFHSLLYHAFTADPS